MKRLLNVRAKAAAEGELVLHEIHPLHPTHTARIMGGDVVKVGRSPAVEAMLKAGMLIDVDEEPDKPAPAAAKTAKPTTGKEDK